MKPLPRAVVLRFRQHLLAHSRVTGGEFHIALRHAEQAHIPLAEALVSLSFVSEDAAYASLSAVAGAELIDLGAAAVSPLAIHLVPERVARRHRVLALAEDNRTITYATADPFDAEIEQDVSFAAGRQARAVLARPTQLAEALDRFYPKRSDLEKLLATLRSTAGASARQQPPGNVSPITELCDYIVSGAVTSKASDVHIEPVAEGALVRYRVDGILETVLTVPADAAPLMTDRFKIMAKADVSIERRPQDGAFTVTVDDRAVLVRLSTPPAVDGEKIVLRVVDGEPRFVSLDSLGYEPDALGRLRRSLDEPAGLVLVTGPTGSGNTTALYASLAYLRNGRRSIVSVEDPVERRIDGVDQVPVNAATGTSFAAVLRSVLRQDPNVLMVGEIRDTEVAQIVGQAAHTGHLVLTSMPAADAASAMTRLLDLGLEPYRVAESLTAVVAQRLVRRLCPACRVPAASGASPAGLRVVSKRMKPGRGCERCKFTGYVERIAVAEVFTPTDEMRVTIAKGVTAIELRQAMKASGHRFLRDVALRLVDEGVTSLEEINRVIAEGTDGKAPVAPAAGASATKRVLIADDDRMIRMLVKLLLHKDGYEVLEAENGREALDLAHVHRPDLLITDLVMPEVDGYQALASLRADKSQAMLPVIVLTAEDGEGVERSVLDLGADDYLVKPFEEATLLQRVRSVFVRQVRMAG